MTKKKLILIGGVIVLCLLICLCVAMCSPVSQEEVSPSDSATGTTGSSTMEYTIEVKNEGGQPLEEIGVYIYTDSTMQELVWFAKTDAEGKLTFTDAVSDAFVAALSNVPAGYVAEEYYLLTGETTQIVLAAGLMEGDLKNITYKLGDLMLDFSVTAADGTEYIFSELLEQKKAIVLNFWYLQCEPCKSEFPYLQEAYEQYSDDVIVLAMNPVNTEDAEIAQFQKDNGYTFPMVKCDPAWEKAMQLTAYPTTVVIDRFGNICLIHKGSVTEAETFETIFEYYSADDYEQTIVKDIEELEEAAGVEQTIGTKDNPIEMGVTSSFQVTVEPGQLMYYNIYRMTTTMYLSIRNENAYVIYNGKTYYPSNGTVGLSVASEGTSTALSLVFGNSGTETQTYTVNMGSAAGTMGNPFKMNIGQFTANVGAGNETGVWYTYTPAEDGLFSIEVESVTAGVQYNISLTSYTASGVGTVQRSLASESTTNDETGNKMVAINGYAGKPIQITVGTLPDSSNTYPAATFRLLSKFAPGETLDSTLVEKITYSINVTDENRNPISGVLMTMQVDESPVTLTTNENGVATTKQVAGTYPVILTVPNGYSARTTEFNLTEKYPSVSIKLDTIIVEMETYTVKVLDAEGNPIPGAYVSIGTGYAETDDTGFASVTVAKGTYTASVTADGYASAEVEVSPDAKDATVTLEKGEDVEKVEYTVKAVDYYGNPVSGITLTFKQNGAVKASATTDSSGEAVNALASGDYTVGVPAGYYTDESKAVLSADVTSVTIVVVSGVPGDVGEIYGNATYYVPVGATYVDGMQTNVVNYFLFEPTVDGVYRFSTLDPNAKLSYWGTNVHLLTDQTNNTDYDSTTNTFTVNIKPSNLGANYIIGLTNATDCVLIIERIGDAILDVTDMEETDYVAQNELDENFSLTIPSGMKLHYIDVFGDTVKYYKGADGYYHLGSETGPILYVNLGETAPYLAMSDCMAVTDEHAVYKLIYVYYDEDGTPEKKESYNACMTQYVNCRCETTDVYPLTDDLIFMLQQANAVKGWGDYDSVDYLFYDSNNEKIPGVNEEIAWMYACCYLDEA